MLSLGYQIKSMQTLTLNKNLNVFGIEVPSFPIGIGEAFDALMKATGDAAGARNYYGISFMNKEGKMIYKAVAEEKYEGEAVKFNYEKGSIEKGEYLYQTLYHWPNKTNLIKEIFSGMMQDEKVDTRQPAIEWYKNNDEMLCMVRSK